MNRFNLSIFSILMLLAPRLHAEAHQPTAWTQAAPLPQSPFAFERDVLTFTNGKFYAKSAEFFFESEDGENWISIPRTWLTTERDRVLVVNTVLPYPGGVVFAQDNVSDGTEGLLLSTLPTLDGHQDVIEDELGELPVILLDDLELEEFGTGFHLHRTAGTNEAAWVAKESGEVVALVETPEAGVALYRYADGDWKAVDFAIDLAGARLSASDDTLLLSHAEGVWESGDDGETWQPMEMNFSPFAGSAPVLVPGHGNRLYEAGQGLFSADRGQSWTAAVDPPSVRVNHETRFANGAWVTVGFDGTIASSIDGVHWTSHQVADLAGDQLDAAYGNDRWVVVGAGTVVVAEVAAYEPPLQPTLPALAITEDRSLVFATKAGVTYRVEQSDDLVGWSSVEELPGDGLEVRFPLSETAAAQYFRVAIE